MKKRKGFNARSTVKETAKCESESVSRSVTPESLRPHGLYSPWNSLGQNAGVQEAWPKSVAPTWCWSNFYESGKEGYYAEVLAGRFWLEGSGMWRFMVRYG